MSDEMKDNEASTYSGSSSEIQNTDHVIIDRARD